MTYPKASAFLLSLAMAPFAIARTIGASHKNGLNDLETEGVGIEANSCGEWWPIWNPRWWSPGVSVHPLDPYSFVHFNTGVLCFWVIGYPLWYFVKKRNQLKDDKDLKVWPLWVGFVIVLALSTIFEIVENSPWVIDTYRANSGTSSDYEGDSYQNIIGDLIVVQAGYM